MKNTNRALALLAVLAGLLTACGGGGGGSSGSSSPPSPPVAPSAPSVSGVYSTDSSFKASAAPRMNQQAYFQVTGSNLPSTLELTVTDCASMSTVSTSATEAHFQCTPAGTAGTKSITVKDQSGGTTLYSNSTTVLVAVVPPTDTSPLPTPTYGFNLGNTFEATWGAYPTPTQAVFTTAAKAGFNAVRIPCAWDFNSDPVTHKINAAYMASVKQAVDWSIAAGMYVVMNDHWDKGWLENNIGATVDPVINAKMNSYWTQIATAFAGYDNHLLFAAANEPNVNSPAGMVTLMTYYQTFVSAVRGVGGSNTKRWLVLQGGGDTSWLNSMPTDPTPGRLMVEYHNYTPSLFTIFNTDQGWGTAIYYWGAAYHNPADPTRNASSPEEGAIDSGFQQLTDQYVSKGIPVMIGEFGVTSKPTTGVAATYSGASSLYWMKYVADSAQAHGLSPFNWSTPSSLFDYATGAITNKDAVAVLTGGIAPPPPNGAPYAVTGLVATPGAGQVALSWNAVNGATSYKLYRTAESGHEPATPSVTGITGTSYTDTGLNDGTNYYYQVVAVNSSGPSGFSPEAHAATPGTNPDPTKFNFETDVQGWSASGAQIAGIAPSSAQHFAGKQSLAVNFNGATAGTSSVDLGDVVVPVGATVSFHIWVPAGHQLTSIQPYLQDFNWQAWTTTWYASLTAGAWNTLTITVPLTYQDSNNVTQPTVTPLKRLGLKISTGAAWTGTLYIDSIDWSAP